MSHNKITKMLLWYVNDTCNLTCDYCACKHEREGKVISPTTIDLKRLGNFLNNTKDTYLIIFTGGGEPFLSPNIIEACKLITEKHYLGLNTNLTSSRVKEFVKQINPKRVQHIISSLHIDQLESRNKVDTFVEHFKLCKEKGFNITAGKVAYPGELDKVDDYRDFFKEKGVKIRFDPYIGSYAGKQYPKAYTEEELKLLGLEKKDVDKFYAKGRLCNAGFNAGVVRNNGDVVLCAQLQDAVIGHIYDKIDYTKTCMNCPLDFCGCPLYEIEPSLYKYSLKFKPKKEKKKKTKKTFRRYVLKERIDRKLGIIGPRIKKLSPVLYRIGKKVEKVIRK